MAFVSLPVLVDGIAKASIILAAAALAAAALRRASASARHLVWTLGLTSALLVPALSFVAPRWELPLVRIAAPAQDGPAGTILPPTGGSHWISDGSQRIVRADETRPTSVMANVPTSESAALTGPRVSISWRVLVLLVWSVGTLLILGRMVLGLIAVRWMSRRTAVVTDAPWLETAQTLAASLGLTRVEFLRARGDSMPMAWGLLRSSVLMPADADGWPADRLRVVLLHELAHVKRRDCVTHLIAQIACAAYWFNPLVWMAARKLRTERERACDDLVLAAGTRGSDYADQLLEIARVMRAGRFPAVLAGATLAMAHRSQLEGRLMAILDPSVPRRGLTRARAIAAAALFALVLVPIAAVQPWAEERPNAVKMTVADQQRASQSSARPDKPIESSPGQAAADNRANARAEEARQTDLQDRIQSGLQAGLQEGIRQGIGTGVGKGVGKGIAGGVADGVASIADTIGGIAGGVASGVAGGIATSVADAVAHELPVEHAQEGGRSRARDPRAVNALMEALKDTDKDVRETAMHALVELRDPRIFEPLVAALKDASADVREQAAFGLGQLRDARAVEPLGGALKDANASVRQQAVFALGQLRAAASVDAIVAVLHDASNDVREQAAFALGQIRDRRAVEPLISMLKDEKPNVREQAAFALGQIRDARAVDALVIALKDANADVREQCAFALGQIRDPRAIDGLTVALKDVNASVRQQAAFALGQIR